MTKKLMRLYPGPFEEVSIKGLYLAHKVHELGKAGSPFVYANFLSSLDGRIALEDINRGHPYIPKHLTTVSDFTLFMELQAQADCIITHGGYMRALSERRLGNILQIKNSDLVEWRLSNGLSRQPDIIIASASLAFPIHASLFKTKQKVYIATGRNASPVFIHYWQEQGFNVLLAGEDKMVQGAPLIQELKNLGYQSIYLVAGPQMLDTVLRDRKLSRLYLTLTHQLMGGKDFRTMLTGSTLGPEGNLELESLFFESESPPGAGQFFTQFNLLR
ncbi:MAG: RibD family protein [Gammaproteobacteria bacterium]